MIRTAICGADEPVAGELLRLLINHPDVDIKWLEAPARDGEPLDAVHKGFIGETALVMQGEEGVRVDVDGLVLCRNGAGAGTQFMRQHDELPPQLRIIDLSPDFRGDNEWGFTYGLSELNRKHIVRNCQRVACPSVPAAAVLPALLPLAKALLLAGPITVSVDAALPLQPGVDELARALSSLQTSFASDITIHTRATEAQPRGVKATVQFNCGVDEALLRQLYDDYYDDHNFTFVTRHEISTLDVVNTCKCIMRIDKSGSAVIVTSVIDPWLKGSAGTAVHNMNLLFGLHEKVGLTLKSSAI